VSTQADGAPVGSVETNAVVSPATQSEGEAHETALNGRPRPRLVTCQADGPPNGSVEVMTLPARSTATQSEADGQEMANRALSLSTSATCHVAPTANGVLDLRTLPLLSMATHKPNRRARQSRQPNPINAPQSMPRHPPSRRHRRHDKQARHGHQKAKSPTSPPSLHSPQNGRHPQKLRRSSARTPTQRDRPRPGASVRWPFAIRARRSGQ
jgi:hypothetical protein